MQKTKLTYLYLKLLLQEFLEHCCTSKHYSFTIKKCGESTCTICHPPRCLPEDFEKLHQLLDPIPGEDLHYKLFEELYGKQTTEDHRSSLKSAKTKTKKITKTKYTMPFCPSAARAKNVSITVNCVECEKPHLLFSIKKLSEKDKAILQGFLDTIFYTCGISFHDTCDLAMAIPPKQTVIHDDTENNDGEANDQENVEEDKENEQNEPDDLDNVDEDSIERNYDNMDDSIR